MCRGRGCVQRAWLLLFYPCVVQISGREMFEFNPDLVGEDDLDEDGGEVVYRREEEQVRRPCIHAHTHTHTHTHTHAHTYTPHMHAHTPHMHTHHTHTHTHTHTHHTPHTHTHTHTHTHHTPHTWAVTLQLTGDTQPLALLFHFHLNHIHLTAWHM